MLPSVLEEATGSSTCLPLMGLGLRQSKEGGDWVGVGWFGSKVRKQFRGWEGEHAGQILSPFPTWTHPESLQVATASGVGQ